MSRLLILLFWSACAAVQAQSTNSLDAYWNLTSIPGQAQLVLGLSTNGISDPSSQNDVITHQEGINNTVLASVTSGSQNRLEINQFSSYNYTDVSLGGVNNSVLLNQTGGANSTSFSLGGANNRFILNQDGGDRIQMLGLQQNNTWLEVAQGSGSNTLTIDNTSLFKDAYGTGIPNLRIEQSGGATATIQNGHIFGN
jgi:hypothetical protein